MQPKLEALLFEIEFIENEVVFALNNLREWTKPQKVKKGMVNMMDDCFINSEPLGVCLIIGAWNYPIQVSLGPVVGAIAAGTIYSASFMNLFLSDQSAVGFVL